MRGLRPLLRRAAYLSGGLGLMRQKLRGALTVVMFHRVIERGDPEFAHADPANTVSARLFDDLLEFFCDHYQVVSLGTLLAAAEGARPLPDHALLISFDDGWADNLRYAAPLLKSRGLPAVVFIAAEPVLSPSPAWWQQQIFDAERRGTLAAVLRQPSVAAMLTPAAAREPLSGALGVVCRLAGLAESERDKVIASLLPPAKASRMMLAPHEVSRLNSFGVAAGIHGYSHLPLTGVSDLYRELRQSLSAVALLSGDAANACALACPHGLYDERVLSVAREVGIRLVFTSDAVLNSTDNGMIVTDRPLGRISMEAPHLANRSGRLDPSAAAAWLWRRSAAPPRCSAGR